jgi:hypothetical protein
MVLQVPQERSGSFGFNAFLLAYQHGFEQRVLGRPREGAVNVLPHTSHEGVELTAVIVDLVHQL